MSKKALLIWERISPKISSERLGEMRLELSVPLAGFVSENDVLKWFESAQNEYDLLYQNTKKVNVESKLLKLVRFQREISSKYPEIKYGFETVIMELILSSKINEEFVKSSDDTGCKFLALKEDDIKKFPVGVYIHMGPNTNVDDIERFIKGKSKLIQAYQLEVYGSKPLRYKSNQEQKNFYRDLLITEYSKHTLKEIKLILSTDFRADIDIDGKPTKEILIQRILRRANFVVSLDNIKQIIRRKSIKETSNRSD